MKASIFYLATGILTYVSAFFPISVTAASAGPLAQVEVVAADSSRSLISRDADGVPRVNAISDSKPTIKDFRTGGKYHSFCFTGEDQPVRELLESLVHAANGDGDSWAETDALDWIADEYRIVALIRDRSGEHRETFRFERCR